MSDISSPKKEKSHANIEGAILIFFFTELFYSTINMEKTINNLIKDNQEEINQILRSYGVPLLDNLGNPLK